jgi:uncharacterized protein (DUF302 family)
MTMDYGQTIEIELPYDEAVPRVKEAFKEQGFGTLTEIDVRATLKEKIDRDIEPYVILGTCNPELASKALDIEREIGLLLPCNVVVTERDGKTLVQALDPQIMVSVPGNDELKPIAAEAGERITKALESLREVSAG